VLTEKIVKKYPDKG